MQKDKILQLLRYDNPLQGEKEEWFFVVKEWDGFPQEVADAMVCRRSDIDQALRTQGMTQGYWWMWKKDWDTGMRPDPRRRNKYLKVWVYDSDFNLLGEYSGAAEVSRYYGIAGSNIRLTCEGKKLFIKNFYFSYKKHTPEEIEQLKTRKQWEIEHNTLSLKHLCKKDEEYREGFRELKSQAPPIPCPAWARLPKPESYNIGHKNKEYAHFF